MKAVLCAVACAQRIVADLAVKPHLAGAGAFLVSLASAGSATKGSGKRDLKRDLKAHLATKGLPDLGSDLDATGPRALRQSSGRRRSTRSSDEQPTRSTESSNDGRGSPAPIVYVALWCLCLAFIIKMRKDGPGDGQEFYVGPRTIIISFIFFLCFPIDKRPSTGTSPEKMPDVCLKKWPVKLSAEQVANGLGITKTTACAYLTISTIKDNGALAAFNSSFPGDEVEAMDRIVGCNGVCDSGARIWDAVKEATASGQAVTLQLERWSS